MSYPPPPYNGHPHWHPHPHHHPHQHPHPHPPPPGMYPPPDGGQVTAYQHPHEHPPPPPFHHHHHHPPAYLPTYPPPDGGQVTAPQYPYYVPGTVMIPVPVGQMPDPNPTYITNYIYHGETSSSPNPPEPELEKIEGQPVELSGDFDWVPITATTASRLTGQAVVGGHEGWDGSLLWVIRSWYNGELIPGKFSVRHNAASIVYGNKELPVQNIEVLIAKPDNLRWIPASNGNIPPGAITGGRSASGETVYIGRARHQLSITPGKVQPSLKTCKISFAGSEVSCNNYDVLCRIT